MQMAACTDAPSRAWRPGGDACSSGGDNAKARTVCGADAALLLRCVDLETWADEYMAGEAAVVVSLLGGWWVRRNGGAINGSTTYLPADPFPMRTREGRDVTCLEGSIFKGVGDCIEVQLSQYLSMCDTNRPFYRWLLRTHLSIVCFSFFVMCDVTFLEKIRNRYQGGDQTIKL